MASRAVAINLSDESEEDIPSIMRTNTTLRASINGDDVTGSINAIDHFANQYTINKMVKNRKHRYSAVGNGHEGSLSTPSSSKRSADSADVLSSRRWGAFFSAFIPCLILAYAYHAFAYLIPNIPFLFVFVGYSNSEHLLIFRIFIATFSILVLALLHWSYLKAKYSHPGPIPRAWLEWDGNAWTRPSDPIYAVDHSMDAASMVITKRSKLYCSQCKVFRPSRTGHCRRCNICVTRIDHHCVFLNNCIGSNNQRYFVQFLVYSEVLLFMYLFGAPFTSGRLKGSASNRTLYVIYIILPLIGVLAFVLVLALLAGQSRTIVRNQTFAEYKFQKSDLKTSINETKTTCWAKFKQRMEERKQRRNAKRETPNNDEEVRAFLHDTDDKDASEELSENMNGSNEYDEKQRNEIDDRFLRYNLNSKWKNTQTVLGSSVLHWFLPLDWSEEEQYKRMMDGSHSFDALPCRHRMKRQKHNIAID